MLSPEPELSNVIHSHGYNGLVGVGVGVGVNDGVIVTLGVGSKHPILQNISHPFESINLTITDCDPFKNGGKSKYDGKLVKIGRAHV